MRNKILAYAVCAVCLSATPSIQAITAYAAEQTAANWDGVVSAFVDGWATEYALANGQ